MKKIAFVLILMTSFSAQLSAQSKMTYAKHKELAATKLEGYEKYYTRLADTTRTIKRTSLSYKKLTKLSNDFAVNIVVSFGECRTSHKFNGNLATYKAKPSPSISREEEEKNQPNLLDSMWVKTVGNYKIIFNYYYCYYTNSQGEKKARSVMLAHYDNGVDMMQAELEPSVSITNSASGTTNIATEAEFKAKLATIAEMEAEVTNALRVFIPLL